MCQQWFSVLGLVFDLVGVLLIVTEWRVAFQRDTEDRKREIDNMMNRWLIKLGEEPSNPDFDDESPSTQRWMWKTMQADVFRRGLLVYVGIAFVVAGFIGQMLGSWPSGDPIFGFRSC